MTTITLKRHNQNFIAWEPVAQKAGQFLTSLSSVSQMRSVYEMPADSGLLGQDIGDCAKLTPAASSGEHYTKMAELAKKSGPAQSWFEEDFISVRHSGK